MYGSLIVRGGRALLFIRNSQDRLGCLVRRWLKWPYLALHHQVSTNRRVGRAIEIAVYNGELSDFAITGCGLDSLIVAPGPHGQKGG